MSGEPDRHKFLSFDVIKTLFPSEVEWLHENRYQMMNAYPDFLDLLSKNQFSHWHMCQVKTQMDNEAKEQAKKMEEEQRKKRDPSQLVGSHRNY